VRVVALLLLVGCDDLWNLERVPPADSALMRDALVHDTGFDPAIDCPPTYDLPLFSGSRYRITDNSYSAWDTSDDCDDDTNGRTHLASAQTRQELDTLIQSLIAKGYGRWWLGAVQPAAGVTLPLDGWLWLTGEPIAPTLWTAGEPNDSDGLETNDHVEQFALIQDNRDGLIDLAGMFGNRGLCECDGLAVSEDAQSALSQSRP
jgi:hypothetical protein